VAGRGATEPTPGIVVIDKPQGWTSHDVVARMRRLAGTSKVGHAGTLDPMATGVLVVGIGKATRLLTYIVGHDKAYLATIRLGQATVTDDAEGDVVSEGDATTVTDEAIAGAVASITGDIQQIPSAVSAIKVDGQRAYKRVRDGEDVALAARAVTVSAFEVTGVTRRGTLVDVDVSVTVSSGTYVRALARDLGTALGVGGHLTALRRTRVGGFGIDDAATLDELAAIVESGAEVPRISLAAAASAILPTEAVGDADATALGYGQRIPTAGEGTAIAVSAAGVAIAILERAEGTAKPVVVFEPVRAQ